MTSLFLAMESSKLKIIVAVGIVTLLSGAVFLLSRSPSDSGGAQANPLLSDSTTGQILRGDFAARWRRSPIKSEPQLVCRPLSALLYNRQFSTCSIDLRQNVGTFGPPLVARRI